MRSRQSRLRFRIRALLVLIALVAFALALLTPLWKQSPTCSRGALASGSNQSACVKCHTQVAAAPASVANVFPAPQFLSSLALPARSRPCAPSASTQDCRACHTAHGR
jgi:hypothetical protein